MSNMKKSSVLAAVATTVASLSVARPVPRPALAERLKAQDCEVYGIVHWGLNTYTDRDKWSDQNINFGFLRYCFSNFGSEDGYK